MLLDSRDIPMVHGRRKIGRTQVYWDIVGNQRLAYRRIVQR